VTTALDIIQDAMEMMGEYAPGEEINAADSSRGLTVLNDMLDSWSNESLTCYAILEQSLLLIPGQFQYTIGPGGYVNGPRPLSIIATEGSVYAVDFSGNIYGMDVWTRAQWNQRGSRNTNSNFPDVLFYDPQFPLGILNFDPVPNIGYTVYFDSYLQIADLSSLTTPFSLPPGYKLAVTTNLAVALKPYYKDAQTNPVVAQRAMESKANIKRTNIRLNVAQYDPEILSRAPGIYNIYTDGFRR
jgi:hypothetical protein